MGDGRGHGRPVLGVTARRRRCRNRRDDPRQQKNQGHQKDAPEPAPRSAAVAMVFEKPHARATSSPREIQVYTCSSVAAIGQATRQIIPYSTVVR